MRAMTLLLLGSGGGEDRGGLSCSIHSLSPKRINCTTLRSTRNNILIFIMILFWIFNISDHKKQASRLVNQLIKSQYIFKGESL